MPHLKASDKNYSYEFSHFVLLMVIFLYVVINLFKPELYIFSIIFIAGLFLFYTWRRILFILITAGISFILLHLFPVLGPIAFIIMLLVFLYRIGYIIQNWRAVMAGFYMYGVGIVFADFAKTSASYYGYVISSKSDVIAYLALAVIVTVIFHFIMTWLYAHGYTLKTAMPIMGVAPLLIILLALPFIKAFDGLTSHVDTTDGNIDGVDTVHNGYQDSVINTPDVHHTHEYNRIGPDGNIQHVRGYIATNPDGVIENNFSYHGNAHIDTTVVDKTNVNTGSTDIIQGSSIVGVFFGNIFKNTQNQLVKNKQNNLAIICYSVLIFALLFVLFIIAAWFYHMLLN